MQNEEQVYTSVAVLVRWVDYESKSRNFLDEKERIWTNISRFEIGLAEIVRLVGECQLLILSGPPGSPRHRRLGHAVCVCVCVVT